jgi:TonB family protein
MTPATGVSQCYWDFATTTRLEARIAAMVRWQVRKNRHKLQVFFTELCAIELLLLLVCIPAKAVQVNSAAVPIKVSSKEADDNLQVKTLEPDYPPEAKAKGIEGTVRLQIVINELGNVIDIRALAGHPLLVPPAVAMVKRFPYRPFIRGGKRVVVTTEVTVPFALHPTTKKEVYDSWRLHVETAELLRQEGWVDAALGELQQALDEAKKLGDMDVATTYGDIATLYIKEGRYGDAEPALTRRLEILQRSQVQDEVEIANTQSNLAAAFLIQRKLVRVQQLLQRAIPVQEKYLRNATLQDSKDVYAEHLAFSLGSLALLHDLQGQFSTAEPLYKRSISLGEQLVPADDAALIMRRYAEMLIKMGRSDDASNLREKATALQLGLSK